MSHYNFYALTCSLYWSACLLSSSAFMRSSFIFFSTLRLARASIHLSLQYKSEYRSPEECRSILVPYGTQILHYTYCTLSESSLKYYLASTSSCSSKFEIFDSSDEMVALDLVFIWSSFSDSLAFSSLFCLSTTILAFSSFCILLLSAANSVVNCSTYK